MRSAADHRVTIDDEPATGSDRAPASLSEEDIIERIVAAVMEQRLPPGTKLSEAALCDAFGARRMRIRRVLPVLASRNLIELQSNRGAFVASPTPDEARSVFEARRTIEPTVVRHAVERVSARDLGTLDDHLAREHGAHVHRNRRDAIRLSGEFHVQLAAIAGNSVFERFIQELVTRTSLIIGLFGAPGVSNCPEDEHPRLVAAIRRRDADRAAAVMLRHLDHIEGELDLSRTDGRRVDVRKVLGG